MSIFDITKEFARVGRNQVRNIARLVSRQPIVTPSLASMTLDMDDVVLAHQLLNDPSCWQEEETTRYELEFAQWNGSLQAFAFMSGREALSACIQALGLQPGDEVIMPGYTCVVVPNAFQFAGIKVVFSDIEVETYGLDAKHIANKITSRTRVILLHHLYGLVCRDYVETIEIARANGLAVIEDCSQSTGALFRGRKIGNLGDIAFTSSEQSKVLNTVQGGMAWTNDLSLATRLSEVYQRWPLPNAKWIDYQLTNVILNYYQFKDSQRWWKGDLMALRYGSKRLISTSKEDEQGIHPSYYGRRMAAPIAALGINQLCKVDTYNDQRRRTAVYWDQWCDTNGYNKPVVIPGSVPVFLRYPVMVEPEKKRDTSWSRSELGVTLGVWYVSHRHPVRNGVDGCPKAEQAVSQCVNFPCII